MDFSINYWSVIAAALSTMVIGALWYGPLFGKRWVALMGIKSDDMGRMQGSARNSYVVASLTALIGAFVLANLAAALKANTVADAVTLGFAVWAGFVAVQHVDSVIWEGKSWKLFTINAGNRLVAILASSLILTLWR